MTPPQMQLSVEELLSAGKLLTMTVDEPGVHGETVFGTQGDGVNSTGGGLLVAGFAGELHIPNGMMLVFGLKSMIVATHCEVFTVVGGIISEEGAAPKLHSILAPPQTQTAINNTPNVFDISIVVILTFSWLIFNH